MHHREGQQLSFYKGIQVCTDGSLLVDEGMLWLVPYGRTSRFCFMKAGFGRPDPKMLEEGEDSFVGMCINCSPLIGSITGNEWISFVIS